MAGNNKPKVKRALAPIGDYEVGYCKPPKATQFQKNQPSANRKGRPPKAKSPSALQMGWSNGFNDMTLEEAARPVQVRDGNKVVTMPAYQAATRAALIKAGNGNVAAYRNVSLSIQHAQQIARAEKEEAIKAAMEYKRELTAFARRMDAEGQDHGLVVHPDDIDFDLLTGEVIILGPKTPEEREVLKLYRKGLAGLKALLLEACADQRAHPRRTSIAKRIKLLIDSIAQCNAVLPERYRCDVQAFLKKEGF